MHVSVQECVGIQTAALLATLWISYRHLARNKCAGFLFEFPFTITFAACDLSYTGPLPILRNECGRKVSESFFLFLLILY